MLLKLSKDEMMKRLLHRMNTSENKRVDDNEEVMKARIAKFEKNIPIFEHFAKQD